MLEQLRNARGHGISGSPAFAISFFSFHTDSKTYTDNRERIAYGLHGPRSSVSPCDCGHSSIPAARAQGNQSLKDDFQVFQLRRGDTGNETFQACL
jgi:hypothetical protein